MMEVVVGISRRNLQHSEDVGDKFMHSSGPSNAFFFSHKKASACWIPFQQILCKIATPTTVSGRLYSITQECNTIANAYIDEQ